MKSAVLDTNVWISALVFPGGTPDQVVKAAVYRRYYLVVCPFIIHELETVLIRKFLYSPEQAQETSGFVRDIAHRIVYPSRSVSVITQRPADNQILACAAEAGADYLVTGDRKHIYPLKNFNHTRILLPSEFLQILSG